MGDYILREIDRIGELLRALLDRAGALRHAGSGLQLRETTPDSLPDTAAGRIRDAEAGLRDTIRNGLRTEAGIDIDALAASPDPVRHLTDRHGLAEEHLELLAELLFDLAAAAPDRAEQRRLARTADALCRHLDACGAPASFGRYLLLQKLEQYLNP